MRIVNAMTPPAKQLLGLSLEGGWTVTEKVSLNPDTTGGAWSEGYVVVDSNDRRGFLKAMDFSKALLSHDRVAMLNLLTSAYLFETELLKRCLTSRLNRIVRPLAFGKVMVDESSLIGEVDYVIFELADRGDIRKHLDAQLKTDTAFLLRTLHHISAGLEQLHGQGIAHQDLKPSNVLVFHEGDTKLADLGRAAAKGLQSPHDRSKIAGDRGYAPPELLYGSVPQDWNKRRFGCDAYLLGSMAVFLVTGCSMTSLLGDHLKPSQHWTQWPGTFNEVLPYVRNAFGLAIEDFREAVSADIRDDLETNVRQLCDPDLEFRGHPRARIGIGNRYSLERYVSSFNLLARRAELGMLR